MSRIRIIGGKPIRGTIKISGSKNAVLPIIAASILSVQPTILYNVPHLEDVTSMLQLLRDLGIKIQNIYNPINKHTISLDASHIKNTSTSVELASKLRASFLLLGPLLGRCQEAKIAWPGGCKIGTRSLEIHLDALRKMGATINIYDDCIHAKGELIGAELFFSKPSVGATENILMAAILAQGRTIIHNAAIEPEVVDLSNCLLGMGAQIEGIGTSCLIIDGVEQLHSSQYGIISDRIEAFTYAAAAIITDGEVILEDINAEHMHNAFDLLKTIGGYVEILSDKTCRIKRASAIKPNHIITGPYPSIPTDIQPILTALLTLADGKSIIEERVFEQRFKHVPELHKMGAQITTQDNRADITGVAALQGHNDISAADLRAVAALVIAALAASGETIINNAHHLDRGYEMLENKLRECGADISRIV